MKKSCVFIFACLWFGNAFALPSAEEVGMPESELAKLEQTIKEDLCSSVGDVANLLYFHKTIGENDYFCNFSIPASNSEEQLPIFLCRYYGSWNDQGYASHHTISCPVETEETENIDDTDTEDTE